MWPYNFSKRFKCLKRNIWYQRYNSSRYVSKYLSCGECSVSMSKKIVEIIEFCVFVDVITFIKFYGKVQKDRIKVSVVVNGMSGYKKLPIEI